MLERKAELVARGDADAIEAVRALDDRYLRLRIEGDGRLLLAMPFLAHLDDRIDKIRAVYLVCHSEELEIWSIPYRNQRMTEPNENLEGLP